jgi:dimethylargininase
LLIALTRAVSDAINLCELTHVAREPIDVARARDQHREYEHALESAGCVVVRVESAPELPDAVFIEDTAVVIDEIAIVTRPGAESRRAETAAVAQTLAGYRELRHISAPGTIDGGDVVICGTRAWVGRSERTNAAGIEQLRQILQPFGYSVSPVDVSGCLHLKSAAASISPYQVLVNPSWIRPDQFAGIQLLEIDPGEPYAANVVRVGATLIHAAAFPRTRERLRRQGFTVQAVDVSELAKAEGAVTCCSVLVRVE